MRSMRASSPARHLDGIADDHVIELGASERKRIFNLGYYTWVEQQGVPLEEFDRRRDQSFWRGLRDALPQVGCADRGIQPAKQASIGRAARGGGF